MILFLYAFFIRGFVKDVETGEPLSYADVYIEELKKGTYTDEKGYFLLTSVPEGKYTITVSYIGYKNRSVVKKVKNNITVLIEIKKEPLKMPEVKITAEKERFKNEVEVSRSVITGEQIKLMPSFLESDLLRSLQTLPGIITFHDLSNKLYVRGGTPDENLIYLDGITVYNPTSHLFGLFSTFNSDAVKNVEAYTGAYPAQYGDRLSSVVNVRTKNGNSKKLDGEASVSLISTRLFLEGPIIKNSSFFISYRRTYFDLLTKLYSLFMKEDISLPYYFYDFISKFSYMPDLNTNMGITLYGSDDVIKFVNTYDNYRDDISITWGNQGISFVGSRFFSHKFFGNFILAYSKFHTDLDGIFGEISNPDTTRIYQFITDFTLKPDLKYEINEANYFLFGADLKYLIFSEGTYYSEMTGRESLNENDSTEMFIIPWYTEIKNKIGDEFVFRTGMRYIYSSLLKKTFIDPRFGMKYFIRDDIAFNFSGGKYHQFLYTINSQESFFSIYDIWKPVEKGKPPESSHLVSGIEKINDDGKIRTEVFYKYYGLLKIPAPTNFMFAFPSDSVMDGRGYSYGAEFYYKKNWKGWTGWLTYTYCITKRNYKEQWYSPAYDRRHTFNIGISKVLGKNSLTIRWNFGTGLPFGGFVGKYKKYYYDPVTDSVMEEWRPVYGRNDAMRLPPSHRLDFHYERNFYLLKRPSFFFVDIINLYAHKNVVFYDTYIDEKGNVEFHEFSFLPIIVVSFGFRMEL